MTSMEPVYAHASSSTALRSVLRARYASRMIEVVKFTFQSVFVWIVFICRLRNIRVSPSASFPTFICIEEEEEEKKRWIRSSAFDCSQRRRLAHSVRLKKGVDEGLCIWQTQLVLNPRKQILFTQSWIPANGAEMKGVLLLLHGLNEHSGRYAQFAAQLNSQGYGVYAMDWIGHGGSDGLHGYVPSLDHVVADTIAFLRWVADKHTGKPCFLFGHSTGGAIALKAASNAAVKPILKGVILTSPALRVRPTHQIFKVIAPVFSFLLPTYQFKGANKRGIPVSRDPQQLIAKYSDPLVYTGPIRIRTGSEILRITSYLQRNLKRITVPFLVMHGTEDRVTDPLASRDLYEYAASKHKSLKLYDGYLHDLLFEPEWAEIAGDIIKWMDHMYEITIT